VLKDFMIMCESIQASIHMLRTQYSHASY